mmetsp:Transcript_75819/g.190728  ORF Transcript_75819/g.190728 Transcript_75819/m.190728 type:complete len:295 (-) Transcript_75819:324-1208(-)
MSAGQWDLSPTPVLLAGADGNVHETRPTTSLARDLEHSETHQSSQSTLSAGTRRQICPDDRPVRGAIAWNVDPSADSSNSRAPTRTSAANRQVGGFSFGAGSSSGYGGSAGQRSGWDRHSGGFSSTAGSSSGYGGSSGQRSALVGSASNTCSSRADVCNIPASKSRVATGGVGTQRRNSRSYDPTEQLLALGFDLDSARAAMAAAGGDVDKAIRLVLEDSQAHDARSLGEWEFEGDKGWVPFDSASESVIKDAISRGRVACEIRIGPHRYLVDFDALLQTNIATQKARRIRRRP